MDNENEEDQPRVQADNNSIAVGGISIGGDISGNITIGHTGYTVEQVSVLLTQITSTFQPKPFDGRCPYKGLEVFEEEDAELFFGRERLVDDLLSRVKESRTVFITGPSGSGKSSLVRAGLIHALKQGAIKNLHSERWLYETMKPGREPIKDLALAFSRLKSPDLADYFQAHASEKDILNKCAESVLSGRKDQRFVLFIDQFEEVFTQISQEEERVEFINMLAHAGAVENGRVIILFAMRSDFVSNCATYPALNEMLSQQFRQIGAMQPEELVSAIALPAKHVGLPIEDELIARIINDMKGEPGALPLMQFALRDLFDAQQEQDGIIALTLEDYLRHGGIHKSLERHADKSFATLSENEQELARSIFSGLIEIGRGTQDTRRTALFDELVPANTKATEVESVVQRLADARLIITDEQAGKDTVTISHEKLIDAWPWLKKLVNENRDVIALQNEITADAKEWDDHRRDPSYLYSGARLANSREQLEAKKLVLSGTAHEFVQAGRTRQQRDQRARILSVSGVAGLVVATIVLFSYISVSNSNELRKRSDEAANTQAALASTSQAIAITAQANAEEAQKQKNIARAGELSALALVEKDKRFDLALLFGLEGLLTLENPRTKGTLLTLLDSHPGLETFLSGHNGWVYSVAFSPDGKWLASGSSDNSIILWDVSNPTAAAQLARLSGFSAQVRSLAFSPDGRWLASGNSDNSIILWDVSNPTAPAQLATLSGHDSSVLSLAFSPDGKWLASGSGDSIILWDMSNPTALAQPVMLSIQSGSVLSLAFSPDGEWLASGSGDSIILWDMSNPTAPAQLATLSEFSAQVRSLAFSPDSKWLASGSDDGSINLWDMNNPTAPAQLATLSGHNSSVLSLAFSPDGKWLASGSRDNSIILWDATNRTVPAQLATLSGHTGRVFSVVFSPNGKQLASGSSDDSIILWDVSQSTAPAKLATLVGDSGVIFGVAFRPDGKILASYNQYNTITLWDISNPAVPTKLAALPGDDAPVGWGNVVFSPDGKWITSATGVDANTIFIWDVSNPAAPSKLATLSGHSANILGVAFSPDGKWLASGSGDHTILLWDVTNLTTPAQPVTLSAHNSPVYSVAFGTDGKWLASGNGDNSIILWDVSNPTAAAQLATLSGHTNFVENIAFSPDGAWLASSSYDGSIILWDVSNPAIPFQLATLSRNDLPVSSVAFSPDGKQLASGSFDESVTLWDLDLTSWVQKACQRVGRNFTRAEWEQYFLKETYRKTCEQWPLAAEVTATAIP